MDKNDESEGFKAHDPDEHDTWDMEVDFDTKEYAEGECWLAIQHWDGPELPILRHGGFMGLDLNQGTTIEEAKELEALLRKHVKFLTFSDENRPEYKGYVGRRKARLVMEAALKKRPGNRT